MIIPAALGVIVLLVVIFFWRLGRDIGKWRLERRIRKERGRSRHVRPGNRDTEA